MAEILSEMTQRVARRLAAQNADPTRWEFYVGRAREIIAEMREPTADMMAAAYDASPVGEPLKAWCAAIDAALGS